MNAAQKLEQFKTLRARQKCPICGKLIANHCIQGYMRCQNVLENNVRLEQRRAKEVDHDNPLT